MSSSASASAKRLGTPRFFGQKWYPMTLRPAVPYAVGVAVWYWAVTKIDQAANGGGHEGPY